MFVDTLFCDREGSCTEYNVTWDQITLAIQGLDNKQITEVLLSRSGSEARFSIMGGSGYYLISATLDSDVYFDLRNPRGDHQASITLVAGRQKVTVGLGETVPLETALKVARRFAEEGIIDPGECWLRSPPLRGS